MIITQYYYSALQSNGKEIHIFENKGSKDIELYSMESAGTQRSSLSISMDGKLFYKTYYGTCNTSQETLFGIPIYIFQKILKYR